MGLFSKPEVVILKESTATEHYLQQLKELQPQARGNAAKKLSAEISAVDAGLFGEKNVLYELKHSGMDMVVLHDLYLKSGSGNTAQIDFFVLTPKLNFVIECKNLWGNIEITDTGSFVRVHSYNGQEVREGIYSPLTQNQHHLQVLKECRGERKTGLTRVIGNFMFDTTFKSLVVLANPKTILEDRNAPKEVKDQVIRADQLINTISRMNRESNIPASSLKELLSFGQFYLALHVNEQPDRIEKFRAMLTCKAPQNETPAEPAPLPDPLPEPEPPVSSPEKTQDQKLCPRCGKPLILRQAKKGARIGQQFYGCSGFPSCRYTEKLTSQEGAAHGS